MKAAKKQSQFRPVPSSSSGQALSNVEWSQTPAILLVLSFGGNAFIRGSFACNYCKQKEIGCPAEKLFSKKTKSDQEPGGR